MIPGISYNDLLKDVCYLRDFAKKVIESEYFDYIFENDIDMNYEELGNLLGRTNYCEKNKV